MKAKRKLPAWKLALYILTLCYAVFLVFISAFPSISDKDVLLLMIMSLLIVGFLFWVILALHHRSETR